MINLTVEQIKRHEGLRLTAYLDSVGVLTVGYGHNCIAYPVAGVRKAGDRIEKYLAESLLEVDLFKIQQELNKRWPYFERLLDEPRYAVLLNMAYNLGIPRLAGFKKMLAALRSFLYKTAAAEMLDSKWARQVGRRAQELAKQMETGKWQIPQQKVGGNQKQ